MRILFRVKKETPQRMLLSLSLWFRGAFALIASLMIAVMVVDAQIRALPLILLLLSVCALGYREQWALDKEANRVSYTLSLLFVLKTFDFVLDEIKEMFVEKPQHKGRPARTGFCMRDGTQYVLEPKSLHSSTETVSRVAGFLQVPIVVS